MSRIFESRKDVRRELATMKSFLKRNKFKYTFEKLDWRSLDFALYDGEQLIAIVEIKNFRVAWNFFPTTIIALKKYIKMLDVKEEFGVPVYFLVNYSCGTLAWIEVDSVDGGSKDFERTEMREGAANDAEEVFFVDNKLFKTI